MTKKQSTRYTYDGLNRLIAVTYGTGMKIVYAYDPAGNMTSQAVGPSTGIRPAEVKPIEVVTKVAIKCSNCGTMVPEGANFCPSCGSPVGAPAESRPAVPAERLCPQCHRPVPAGKKFCTYDGTPIPSQT